MPKVASKYRKSNRDARFSPWGQKNEEADTKASDTKASLQRGRLVTDTQILLDRFSGVLYGMYKGKQTTGDIIEFIERADVKLGMLKDHRFALASAAHAVTSNVLFHCGQFALSRAMARFVFTSVMTLLRAMEVPVNEMEFVEKQAHSSYAQDMLLYLFQLNNTTVRCAREKRIKPLSEKERACLDACIMAFRKLESESE